MVSECDRFIKTAIPAVRIAVAKLLKSKYRMDQQEIAKRMGVTQTSVNKYLNGRYSAKINGIVAGIRTRGFDRQIAGMIASGKRASLVNEGIDRAASSMYYGLVS